LSRTERVQTDIAVIGAGPCGIGVGIAATRAGLGCVLIDKDTVAGSIGRYPTFMTFFSTAERLEIGGVPFTVAGDKPVRREALRYYQKLVDHFSLDVRQYHDVEAIEAANDMYTVSAMSHTGVPCIVDATNVVIATGYFDHPNRLGVPGEQLPKVSHGYREGYPYFRQNVVIVGGGNSAVDAALELYRWNARVTLVHFEAELDRGVKPWVRPDIINRMNDGSIDGRFRTRVAEIRPASVILVDDDTGRLDEIANDWVLTMTGYTPDPALLRSLGVPIDAATGIPAHDPATMQTDVPGVFIAGVLAAGHDANKVFIENGRDHGSRIVASLIRDG
jgi:thioredoxin reductase (NADPH)